jgi:hypothetical protein
VETASVSAVLHIIVSTTIEPIAALFWLFVVVLFTVALELEVESEVEVEVEVEGRVLSVT